MIKAVNFRGKGVQPGHVFGVNKMRTVSHDDCQTIQRFLIQKFCATANFHLYFNF